MKDRDAIDSIFRERIKFMKVELDSICDVEFDDRVQYAVDSMMHLRLAEKKRQLDRIKQYVE